jgi:hypothetical protein
VVFLTLCTTPSPFPQPSEGGDESFSTAAQACRLAVTSTGRSFLSTDSYPCRMVEDPEAKLGTSGRCFGAPQHKARLGF